MNFSLYTIPKNPNTHLPALTRIPAYECNSASCLFSIAFHKACP